jgi:hypothetical protein
MRNVNKEEEAFDPKDLHASDDSSFAFGDEQ